MVTTRLVVSLRAYARSRKERGLPGGTLSAVQKAIKAGRIFAVDGGIDPNDADARWDPSATPDALVRRDVAAMSRPKPTRKSAKKESAPEAATPNAAFSAARTRIAEAEAAEKEFNLAVRRGEYIKASEVAESQQDIAVRVREHVLNLTARYSARIASACGCDDRKHYTELERAVKLHLRELSEILGREIGYVAA